VRAATADPRVRTPTAMTDPVRAATADPHVRTPTATTDPVRAAGDPLVVIATTRILATKIVGRVSPLEVVAPEVVVAQIMPARTVGLRVR